VLNFTHLDGDYHVEFDEDEYQVKHI